LPSEAELAHLDTIKRICKGYLQERGLNESDLHDLLAARDSARKNKNWAAADRIRDELARMGITLQDNKDGSTTAHVTATGQAMGKSTARAEGKVGSDMKK
jgi:cysteinyl-tRNA synthetase